MKNIVRLLTAVLLLTTTAKAAEDDRICLDCHAPFAVDSLSEATKVDPAILDKSVHKDLLCNDCHNVNPQIRHVGANDVLCGRCHTPEAESYANSPHVEGRQVSVEHLPVCFTCHGAHGVLAIDDPRSSTNHRNSVQICVSCHEDALVQREHQTMPQPQVIRAYENSVHGQALLLKGNMEAPACVDCHGSHSFLPSDQPESPVYKTHIAETCGRCHVDIAAQYQSSVHGVALARGEMETPTCTDCHGEHNIQAHFDPESKVFAGNIPRTCSECHTSEVVVAKYGLKADRIATFKESFHGVATELGETKAANCASCHGIHNIYEQSDPRSLIHQNNIQTTCGQCHEGLPAEFAQGTVHTSATQKESGGKFYVRQFYIWFISVLILGFITWRILEYKRRVRRVE